MRSIFFCLTSFIILLIIQNAYAKKQFQIETNIKNKVSLSSEGTEFYLAFPLNDNKDQIKQNLSIYVTSGTDNIIRLSSESFGVNIIKEIKANETIEFSSFNEELGIYLEIVKFEEILNSGIKLTSSEPVSVFCMNSKNLTSDGYMAIPTKSWGTDYIHNSYIDVGGDNNLAGGFVVIAKEDDTEVTINIKDGLNKTEGFGKTTSGKQHGDVIKVTLNTGEVYAVQGDGSTNGTFDLSGTLISSSKEVGLISYHNRTKMPVNSSNNGMDYLVEMIPPTKSWGSKYTAIDLGQKTNVGNYYRVIAGVDSVTFSCIWYDKETNDTIKSVDSISLKEKGDWYSLYGNSNSVSRFEADGPILVVQYSYSSTNNNTIGLNPFMVVLASEEQFIWRANFTKPQEYANIKFDNNFISLIAIGDTTNQENNESLLNSITLNGEKVTDMYSDFVSNKIPFTNKFWIIIKDTINKTFYLEGKTPFSASIYGHGNYDAFGWPATSNSASLQLTDTLSPEIINKSDECNFQFIVQDDPNSERNGNQSDTPRQIDTGIDKEPKLKSGSFNFNAPVYLDSDGNEINWSIENVLTEFELVLSLIDAKQDAMAILEILDKEGNATEITLFYEADKVSIVIENSAYILRSRVNTEVEANIKIRNLSSYSVTINDITLKENSNFRMDGFANPVTLGIDSIYTQSIYYHPKKEYIEHNFGKETDTIEVELDCLVWKEEAEGQGFIPSVEVSNMTFSPTKINEGTSTQKGNIVISNVSKSSDKTFPDLLVKSIEIDINALNADLFSNFKVVETNTPISDDNDITLSPGQSITVEFDLNTNAENTGDKIARLIVTTDSGPASTDGTVPTTINNYDVEFDGNYTVNNSSALNDGGYIIATLIDSIQSSVEGTLENQQLKISIVNANPMNTDILRLSLTNAEQSIVSVSITDIEGRVVMELMNEYVGSEVIIKEFNVSELNSGTYFISASDGTHQTTTKFIVAE